MAPAQCAPYSLLLFHQPPSHLIPGPCFHPDHAAMHPANTFCRHPVLCRWSLPGYSGGWARRCTSCTARPTHSEGGWWL